MKAIFFLVCFVPKPTGASHAAIRLARTLRALGVEVEFIVHDFDGRWADGGEYEGFPVRSFYLAESGKWKKLRGLTGLSRYLFRHRRSFDVFHIHGGGYVNFFLGWWVKFLTGRKTMLKITSDGWDTPDGAGKEKYGRLVHAFYRRLDGVVAMTSGQAIKCSEWGFPGLLATIPNGVDCEKYQPVAADEKQQSRLRLNIPVEDTVLAYTGWLGYGKGTDVLLKVWERLRQMHGNLTLLLLGNYMDFLHDGNVVAFLKEHGLDPAMLESDRIISTGRIDNVEEYLQVSDIFIFPSRREGFGTVQIEAMACGLSCVVNDLPGVSCDIYPDEQVGFRVQDNHVDEMVRICDDLIRHPDKRMLIGQAARQRVVEQFSLESVGRRYIGFYGKLLKG